MASASAFAQGNPPAATPSGPLASDLKGITIGMPKAEVREKLGKPSSSDKTSMVYKISKIETFQIGLNSKGNVRTVALIYTDEDADAPKFSDIFGPDVPMETKKNGSVYKLVRYPSAGFWIAYSRSIIDKKPLTTITMRKLEAQSLTSGSVGRIDQCGRPADR
jgi:hypothetical protein